MKYSLSCRHTLAALREYADEIKINSKDIQRIRDFATEDWKGTKNIVIDLSDGGEIDWPQLKVYQEVLNITIACPVSQFTTAQEYQFDYYWAYPISTYYELQGLLDLGVSQILIEAPLTHDLIQLKKTIPSETKIRMCINKCFNDYMPRKNGIVSSYIRPEDIIEYEPYINVAEFVYTELSQELTYYRVYKKGIWNGNLNILLPKLNYDVDNRGFELVPTFLEEDEPDIKLFAHRRISCGQVCQRDPHKCKFCYTVFNFITTLDKTINTKEN